jgi:hypothetical protein
MTNPAITIRRSHSGDESALERIAALDSAHTRAAPVLLAEVDGALQAAISLHNGAVVADPFVDTRIVRTLLVTRAGQLRGHHVARRRRGIRAATPPVPAR